MLRSSLSCGCHLDFARIPGHHQSIEPGVDDLLPLAVLTPMPANNAVRLTFHYGTSNSKLNGFPAPVASNSEMNVIAWGGRGMNAFRCVTG
jgi:hypothetical protein